MVETSIAVPPRGGVVSGCASQFPTDPIRIRRDQRLRERLRRRDNPDVRRRRYAAEIFTYAFPVRTNSTRSAKPADLRRAPPARRRNDR
jgi:hypothetical protein